MGEYCERLYSGEQEGNGEVQRSISEDFLEHFPCLADFLTCVNVGGKRRDPGTLLLFVEEGQFKAMLHDKDRGMTGWLTIHNTSCFFQEVEIALNGEDVDWRRKKAYKGAR